MGVSSRQVCSQPCHPVPPPFLCVEIFDPEKDRDATVSKPNKKSSRSRQH